MYKQFKKKPFKIRLINDCEQKLLELFLRITESWKLKKTFFQYYQLTGQHILSVSKRDYSVERITNHHCLPYGIYVKIFEGFLIHAKLFLM